jgi:hypothetical protein
MTDDRDRFRNLEFGMLNERAKGRDRIRNHSILECGMRKPMNVVDGVEPRHSNS